MNYSLDRFLKNEVNDSYYYKKHVPSITYTVIKIAEL